MIGIFAVRTFRGWGRPRRKWEASWGLEYATILQWLIHCKNREENEKQAHRESVIHIHFMSQFCKKINHRIEKHCKTCERDWSEVVAIYAPQQEHRHATNSLGMKIPLSILPSLQSTHNLSTSIIRENTQILCLEHIFFPEGSKDSACISPGKALPLQSRHAGSMRNGAWEDHFIDTTSILSSSWT